MIGSHHWQKSSVKIVVLSRVGETCSREDSDHPRPKEISWHWSCVADIFLQIGWETNASHTEC